MWCMQIPLNWIDYGAPNAINHSTFHFQPFCPAPPKLYFIKSKTFQADKNGAKFLRLVDSIFLFCFFFFISIKKLSIFNEPTQPTKETHRWRRWTWQLVLLLNTLWKHFTIENKQPNRLNYENLGQMQSHKKGSICFGLPHKTEKQQQQQTQIQKLSARSYFTITLNYWLPNVYDTFWLYH